MPSRDHLFIAGFTQTKAFKSNLRVFPSALPQRDRQSHGTKLLKQLAALQSEELKLKLRRAELDLPTDGGMTIVLEIQPAGAIDYFKRVEWKTDGIEVLSAVAAGDKDVVALHIPSGALAAFERRIDTYLKEDGKADEEGGPPKPRYATLVNAISAFRTAAFNELWTDVVPPEQSDEPTWFQVWIRDAGLEPQTARDRFVSKAKLLNIDVDSGFLVFPGRVVLAVRATRAELEAAVVLLDMIAEIRGVMPTAEFFLSDLAPHEQAEWVDDLQSRSSYGGTESAPYIALLDTGVNNGHPLLGPVLSVSDLMAVETQWGSTDHDGHGTQMAGLIAHGDLTAPLSSTSPHIVPHRLESVKIWPPTGANKPHLYGVLMAQATSCAESHSSRRRAFVMMTTCVGQTAGMPSEWSATIDRLACGGAMSSHVETPAAAQLTISRLFVLAAGNVPWPSWGGYPNVNSVSAVEDPGQAWNALTVGACTDLTSVDAIKWPALTALSSAGALSPSSTTSQTWQQIWPFKPDVVAEGGNGCVDGGNATSVVVGPESLRVLTTSHQPSQTSLAESGDTSAAAAEVARICGHLMARYPTYWPETIRALVIQGARFTPHMRSQFPSSLSRDDKIALLRQVGYGRVNLDASLVSTENRATLVLQEVITPYVKANSGLALGNINMHALPWPTAELQDFGDARVQLRITLSYFVEPNPARRGWQSRYRYPSYAMRFAVKGAAETEARFNQRINQIDREEAGNVDDSIRDEDAPQWLLGSRLRNRGSVHSDVWTGSAASLAEKSHVAVFPVGGWWKDSKDANGAMDQVRYSLVLTLEILSDIDVDIYTPIATQITTPVEFRCNARHIFTAPYARSGKDRSE